MMLSVNKQLVLFCLSVLFLFICKADVNEKRTKIVLRTIGHQFLMELEDSTSLVLPIETVNERYAVRFERNFSFIPDILTSVVYRALEENQIHNRFIVEIEECDSGKVVHSFEAGLSQDQETIACRGRALPEACYAFYFTVLLPVEDTAEVEIATANKQKYVFMLMPLLLVGGIAIYLVKRKGKQESGKISIGQFHFDQKKMTLSFKATSVELSAKESDLLLLLFKHENKTLERGYILNQIWGDEGDYVGRTLDVFISKLRKKLSADPNLKIINVRGVGYRFVEN